MKSVAACSSCIHGHELNPHEPCERQAHRARCKLLLRGLQAIVACVPARGREDGYSVVVEAQEGPLGNSLLAVEIETRPNGPEVECVGRERRFERVDRLTQPSACIHHLDRIPVVRAPDSYLIGDSTGVGKMPSDVDLQVFRAGEGLPAKRGPERPMATAAWCCS